MTKLLKEKITQRSFIKASKEKIYDTISSADGWNAFFTHDLEVEPKPGGKIIWRWKDWGPDFYTVEAEGKVVAVDPPHKFAFQWHPAGKEYPTTITFDLNEAYGGTVLTITEEGYPNTSKGRSAMLECACGWGEAATLLKFYLEHGIVYTPPEK